MSEPMRFVGLAQYMCLGCGAMLRETENTWRDWAKLEPLRVRHPKSAHCPHSGKSFYLHVLRAEAEPITE